jgi:hypothetical protein
MSLALQWRTAAADTREDRDRGAAMKADAVVSPGAQEAPSADGRADALGGAGRRPSRRRPLAVLLLVLVTALAAAAVLLPGALAALPGLAAFPPVTVVGVPAGLALLAALLRVRHARRTTAAPTTHAGVSAEEDGEPSMPMDPRVLAIYARTLEGALSEEEGRAEEVRREAEQAREASARLAAERTHATVQVMRQALADQPGVVAVGRTEAALARLGVEPTFARPLLPSGPAGTLPVTFGFAPTPQASVPAAPAPADTADGPGPAPEDPSGAEPPGRPRVLPVPAPPTPATPSRRRRRRRNAV